MDTQGLRDLGLSNGEVRVYLSLLRTGPAKVGKAIEQTRMASSAVHNALNVLAERGLVSFVRKGGVRVYCAVPPADLVALAEERKQRIEALVPELERLRPLEESPQEAEIFTGVKGIAAMLQELIEGAGEGDEYLFFSVDVPEKNEEIQRFFARFDPERIERGLVVKGIAAPTMKRLFARNKLIRMRYVRFPIPKNMSICRDRIALFSWTETPVGYLIRSSQVAGIYKNYFQEIWETTS